jgi:hypothetical protein
MSKYKCECGWKGDQLCLLADLQTSESNVFRAVCPECETPNYQVTALLPPNPQPWLPTPANINALPEPIRKYIHNLETLCDPAGIVTQNTLARDRKTQLVARLKDTTSEQHYDLNFIQACLAMEKGRKVRREAFVDYLDDGTECVLQASDEYFILTLEDCLANDWEIKEEDEV